MEFVMDELKKSLKYHNRQFKENVDKIHLYEDTIEDLKNRNKAHEAAMLEIDKFIEKLKQG
jgi:hypothetical protein